MERDYSSETILVTGVTGFLGSQTAAHLLEKGYKVRGTVRSVSNKAKIEPLDKLPNRENLSLVEGNLLDRGCWDNIVEGCQGVIHTASPFPAVPPKRESELIKPAVDGTLNVLKACTNKGIKRVVFTSSLAAIASLGPKQKELWTEDDWNDIETAPPYEKSKTLAEKAAWEYYDQLPADNRFKLTAINPTLILGPSIIKTDFTSGELIKQFMTNKLIGIPKINFACIDVRDCARAHVLALESEISGGKRYICSSDSAWIKEIGNILRAEFQQYGYKITKSELKYCTLSIGGIFDKKARTLKPYWGKIVKASNARIKGDLHMDFFTIEEMTQAMAYSMIENGVIPNKVNPPTKKK
jgi:dihydroflavonol-4-reductase